MYTQVHKYLDSDKVIAILAVYHSILEFKLNNERELYKYVNPNGVNVHPPPIRDQM